MTSKVKTCSVHRRAAAGMIFAPALLGLCATQQAAASAITQRDSTYMIDFSGGNLSSATTQYTVTMTMPSGGVSGVAAATFKSGNQGVQFLTSGGITSQFQNESPGTTSETAQYTNNGSGGTLSFVYTTANGPNFTSSWTESTLVNGHDTLAFGGIGSQGFGGCGSGLVDIGGIFTCEVFLQGNWANGMGTGDAYVTNLSAGYSIVQNFVYNPTMNWTLLAVSTGNYNGVDPQLGLNLVGASVPEPTSLGLFGAGLLGFGLMMRRRSKGTSV